MEAAVAAAGKKTVSGWRWIGGDAPACFDGKGISRRQMERYVYWST